MITAVLKSRALNRCCRLSDIHKILAHKLYLQVINHNSRLDILDLYKTDAYKRAISRIFEVVRMQSWEC